MATVSLPVWQQAKCPVSRSQSVRLVKPTFERREGKGREEGKGGKGGGEGKGGKGEGNKRKGCKKERREYRVGENNRECRECRVEESDRE